MLAFSKIKNSPSSITTTMLLIQDILLQRTEPWYISHIRAHTWLPGILTKGNEIADTLIMSVSMDILEQARMLHQQFHLTPQSLHKLLTELPIVQCKHLSRICATCAPLAPLGPLQRTGVNPRGLMPNVLWQMDVTHYAAFGNLRYVHVIVDTYSGFIYALAMSGEKASNATKMLKSAMWITGVPWALKTDNGPAYKSHVFEEFINSWKISHTTGIPYNPQGQAIVERTNRTLKEALYKNISQEAKRDHYLALVEVLFHLNFLAFDDKGLSPAYKHWAFLPRETPLPLARWRDPLTQD